jgi:hypothetical protein
MGIGRQRRRFVKQQFQKMAEGDLVGDQEKRAMEGQMVQAAQQGVQAQQAGLARAAQGQAAGSPLQGALTKGAQQLGKTAADAGVKAAGEANKLSAAVREQRAAQALAAGERLVQQNREDVKSGVNTTLQVAEIGSTIAGL